MDEAFEIEAQALAQVLDELDYFQILKVGQNSSPGELKLAYYRESRAYHPDRFLQLPNVELREAIGKIYKRINEAYVCLRDDSKRVKYLADISGADRQKKLRFVEASEQELKKEKEQEVGATPQGRKFFMAGLADLAAQRFASAERNFKMALTYEPANVNFKAKRDEAAKLVKTDMSVR
ncbi:MAG TPA: DnaJ domain-containing protein [Myxococcales bacterium]|jgi:DnaJ-class molecular chaperone|nr:DnaJ domain-containing protein [Myxococcales bacterium]